MLGRKSSLDQIMGFIRKLLTGVSSAALLIVGGATEVKDARADDGRLQIVIRPPPRTNTFQEFLEKLNGNFNTTLIEPAIVELFAGVTVERIEELPTFARELRELKLDPVAEVVAIETMLALVPLLPRTMISEDAANEVAGQIFDEFVSGGPFIQTNLPAIPAQPTTQEFQFSPVEIEFDPEGYTG